MTTTGVFIAVLAAVLAAAAVLGSRNRKRERTELYARLLTEYGKRSEEPLQEEKKQKLDLLLHSADRHPAVDEITWNDLDMDRIYAGMNTCRSGAGELYLYTLLHEPARTPAGLSYPEEMTAFWSAEENAPLRTEVLAALSGTGNRGQYEGAQLRSILESAQPLSAVREMMALVFPVAAFLIMVADTRIGILLLLAALAFNIVTYFRTRSSIAGPLSAIAEMLRLADSARFLPDLSGTPAAAEYDRILALRRELAVLGRGSAILLREPGDPFRAVLDYLCMLFHLDLLMYIPVLNRAVPAAGSAETLSHLMGRLDASIAIASWRESLPVWCVPDLSTGNDSASLHVRGLIHPLLSSPVANDLDTDRPVLITGSNASGKSTFLKSCAIAALLAQTIGTVPSQSYAAPCMRIYTSMALRDSLQDGQSYFIVEILSLKRILDASAEQGPILCCIDEVLRGTGTVERIAASTEILQEMARRKVLCMAATHDGELCGLLEEYFTNYHFSEELSEGDVRFSYRLQEGPSRSRNAIRLLGQLSYDSDLVQRAEQRAQRFLKEGVWEK